MWLSICLEQGTDCLHVVWPMRLSVSKFHHLASVKYQNSLKYCIGTGLLGFQCFDAVGWAAGRASGL